MPWHSATISSESTQRLGKMGMDHLPVEIIGVILQFVALESTECALKVGSISQFARSWTESILYHTVMLSSMEQVHSFACTIETRRHKEPHFFTQNVRNLVLTLHPSIYESIRPSVYDATLSSFWTIVFRCSGITTLSCDHITYNSIYRDIPDTVKHLYVDHMYFARALKIPPTVTRLGLAIRSDIRPVPTRSVWPIATVNRIGYPSLTHLLVIHDLFREPARGSQTSLADAMVFARRVIGDIPTLRVLIVVFTVFGKLPRPRLSSAALGKEGFMLFFRQPGVDVWRYIDNPAGIFKENIRLEEDAGYPMERGDEIWERAENAARSDLAKILELEE
ncbi:hypothetical protein CYLTODRAFT_407338 [Cylindrobasidium torrendii FP15055 ss-10]|uniref:F-box domain-containing protein n=1 Tax=Cylindrobasidium torrendii FP15055 ss-10 TaxID=1314674 RepID=A0A0D7BPS6_9AGAR|nr:hypothetical protein CYLTODRAFT_407338 [Cylindrobasidium torrendii FP15055 ss-10]